MSGWKSTAGRCRCCGTADPVRVNIGQLGFELNRMGRVPGVDISRLTSCLRKPASTLCDLAPDGYQDNF